MESTSLYDYNEDELLASIAASVYPNAKIRGVEWSVQYSGRGQLLPHADYLNLIQIISKLIRVITDLSNTASINLRSIFLPDDLINFEIERNLIVIPDPDDQSHLISKVFERMKLEYVGGIPSLIISEDRKKSVVYTVSFQLRGNEVYQHLKLQKKIMIAETDRTLLSAMADALSREGFVVAVSEDPVQIMSMVESFHPDVLLIALNLGGQNGLGCSSDIRKRFPERKITIFALLASPESANTKILHESGISGYLLKPRVGVSMNDFVSELSERIRFNE